MRSDIWPCTQEVMQKANNIINTDFLLVRDRDNLAQVTHQFILRKNMYLWLSMQFVGKFIITNTCNVAEQIYSPIIYIFPHWTTCYIKDAATV